MSDLYLILRHRLEAVKDDWFEIDGKVLIAARRRQGLSREAFGPMIGVVAKTVERYEKENRVPRQLLPKIAEVLELEIERQEPLRVTVDSPPPDDEERLGRLERLAEENRELLVRVLGLLGDDQEAAPPGR